MEKVRVAIVGVGNCASSLVQGVRYYSDPSRRAGLIHNLIGGYGPGDVEFVLAIDTDARKVGRDLAEAIFAPPNCTARIVPAIPATGVIVMMGRILDGMASHMLAAGERGFVRADEAEADREFDRRRLEGVARRRAAQLPPGRLGAGDRLLHGMRARGRRRGRQLHAGLHRERPGMGAPLRPGSGCRSSATTSRRSSGATIVHRVLSNLFRQRGVEVAHTYQLNTGGNTDFLNMLDRDAAHVEEGVEDRGGPVEPRPQRLPVAS